MLPVFVELKHAIHQTISVTPAALCEDCSDWYWFVFFCMWPGLIHYMAYYIVYNGGSEIAELLCHINVVF